MAMAYRTQGAKEMGGLHNPFLCPANPSPHPLPDLLIAGATPCNLRHKMAEYISIPVSMVQYGSQQKLAKLPDQEIDGQAQGQKAC